MSRFVLASILCVTWLANVTPAGKPERTILIDRAWLARRGVGPYLLDQADTTYQLRTDVRVQGTAFVVDAANVTLDLAGHTVVYGDSPPILVPNGSFEQGEGRNVPGWNLDEAPSARLVPNTAYLFGSRMLRLERFTTTQRFHSDPIALPATRHLHVASITPGRGDYRTRLRLAVVDADTGKVLGEGRSGNVERGFSALASFTTGTARRVQLQIEVSPPPGESASVDLDLATLCASGDHGVVATNIWTGELPGWSNIAGSIRNLNRKVANFTVRNGVIHQGAGRGHGSSPLFCSHVRGLVLDRIQTFTNGPDTSTVVAERATQRVIVRGCTFRHYVENISDRTKSFATLRLLAIDGPITIEDNRFEGVPQMGILIDGARSGHPVLVLRNRFQQKAVVTNGYAITVAATRNFHILDNHVVAENGRGIDIDSYREGAVEDGLIRGNHIEARERLDREYPTRMETRAMRLRNTVDKCSPHRNLRIENNTLIAYAGPGLAATAFGLRLSYQNRDGKMTDANIRIEGNTLRGIVLTKESGYLASALAVDGLDAGVGLHIRDNLLESNDASLTIGDTQGPVAGGILWDNTLVRLAEGAERAYVGIHAGYWKYPVANIAIIDSRFQGGATMGVRWRGEARKEVGVGHRLHVQVRQGTELAPGASVELKDREGKVVFQGKTNEKGECRDIPVVTQRHVQPGPDTRKSNVVECGPFQLSATRAGRTATSEVRLEQGRTIELSLGE